MRVLVLGGAGFLGSALCKLLLKDKNTLVQVLDTFSHGFPKEPVKKPNLLPPVVASITNHADITRVMERFKPDVVVHLAASNTRPENLGNFKLCAETNYVGSANVAHAILSLRNRPKRVIFASSVAANNPRSHFGIAKRAAEDLLQSIFSRFPELGVDLSIIRMADVYGMATPYSSTSLINFLVDNVLLNNNIALDGPNARTSYIHVDDAAAAFKLAVFSKVPGNVFELGEDNPLRAREVFDIIRGTCDYSGKVMFRTETLAPITDLIADTSKAKDLLGFNTAIPTKEGIEALIKKRKKVIK